MGWARVKVFQLSDGKISARFWHIATRRQMWLQLKTVTPHANQPEQLHSPLSTLHSRSLPFSPLSEVDSSADPFTQVSQPEHASDRQADWQTDRSRNRNMANCKKKIIHYFSFNCFFHTFENFQRQPEPQAESQ